VDCYLTAIQRAENQTVDNQFVGIKAGYMIGILGNAAARDALVDALNVINNPAVRFVTGETIDHLTPNGSKAVSSKLDAIITRNAHSADREKVANDAALKLVKARIDGRG
jgi:hypothetical protein